MQIHIRPFRTIDAAELQAAVLESVGHIGPWLDWCTPGYSLVKARDWVSESHALWVKQSAYRWLITDEQSRSIWGCVEISQPDAGVAVGRMGYWVRRRVLGRGICTQAARAALDYVFQRKLFEQVALYIEPANDASLAVARKLGAQLQGEKADEISYRGQAKSALHFVVAPEGLVGPQEGTLSRRAPNSTAQPEEPTAKRTSSGSVYDFRRSLKNARQ